MIDTIKKLILITIFILLWVGIFRITASLITYKERPIKSSKEFLECVDILDFEAMYSRDSAERMCFDWLVR